MRAISKITKDQSRDTGIALVFLLLFLFVLRRREGLIFAAMALQALNMVFPQAYRPLALLWLDLSELLGSITSKILLSIVFFGVVTSIGLLRRLLGKDPLLLKAFKADDGSAMRTRNHKFVARDIEQPF